MSDQYINKVSFELGKVLFTHTPIIIDRTKSEKLVSSSLILKYEQDHFIIMAGHTLKYCQAKNLGLTFGNFFLSIANLTWMISNPSLRIESDMIDVAIAKLDIDFVSQLPLEYFNFYDLKNVDPDFDDISESNYILFGYPLNRSKVKAAWRKIRIEPFNYRTNVVLEEEKYTKYGIHKATHQILYYRKRKINDGFSGDIITGPDPRGMSGCGIWCVPSFETSSLDYFPTGIITEFDNDKCAFIGTRIRVITEILRQNFEIKIPPSRRFDLDIGNHVPALWPLTNKSEQRTFTRKL